MKTISFNELSDDVQRSIAMAPHFAYHVRTRRSVHLRPCWTGGNERGWRKVVDVPGSEQKTGKIIQLRGKQ
jgi:hypothetical protein